MRLIRTCVSMLLLVCIETFSFGQDVITKSDGSKVEVKVIEVHPDQIHYKKYNNLEGPTYVVEVGELKEVKYENGEVESFTHQPKIVYGNGVSGRMMEGERIEKYGSVYYYQGRKLSQRKLQNLIALQGNSEAIEMYDRSKTTKLVAHSLGYISIPVGLVGMAATEFFLPGLTIGSFVVFNLLQVGNHVGRAMYKNQRARAVELYNDYPEQKEHDSDDYY